MTPTDLDDLLPKADFHEIHRRNVDLPVDRVWAAALAVTLGEIRALGPLTALRELPSRIRHPRNTRTGPAKTMLDAFAEDGFLMARTDAGTRDGRAAVVSCAVGKFWSPTGDEPQPLADVAEFTEFKRSGFVRVAAILEAVARGDRTELVTETRVAATDLAARRAFARYWVLIRLPSGLIRRSWLRAIDRRAHTDLPLKPPSLTAAVLSTRGRAR